MAEQLNVAMVQMEVGKSLDDNLSVAEQKCIDAAASGAELVVLPEYFADMFGRGADPRDREHQPQKIDRGSVCTMLSETAAREKITIHGGSFLEQDGPHTYNTTPVYGPDGNLIATYRKQHPFHCPAVPQGSGRAEIDFIAPGQVTSVYAINGFRVGCAICWDLRFPDLFAAYRRLECDLIICPAVFFADVPTNIQFWESLLRGRAIDSACYIASATECGQTHATSDSTRPSTSSVRFNGVTRLVDPMGDILARAKDHHADLVQGTIHKARLIESRENYPGGIR
ncbi:MAG: nitrilase-related carbon-nitrogen hydrolase [Pirellulaceae bacterium]|nr:hypothetical protein [Planctomycetaceae bacterium]MDG2381382.1 nitrilase-related carbon-nitrogen hydrolase [Pirellulaceae bacterium]